MDSAVLVANQIEAWLATGDWDRAEVASAAALRGVSGNFPYMSLMLRADLEMGRGDADEARGHLAAALATLPEDRDQGIYDVYLAELALAERRWIDADRAVRVALARATPRQAAQLHVWFSAKGLRAHAELAALARARREPDAVRAWLARAGELVATARRAAALAAPVTPNARGWLLLAEAEYERACAVVRPESWAAAASGLGRPRASTVRRLLPLAADRGAGGAGRRPGRERGAAPRGPRRRGADRRAAPSAGARASRPACAARPGPTSQVSRAGGTAITRSSASRPGRWRCSTSWPAATRTARSPPRS